MYTLGELNELKIIIVTNMYYKLTIISNKIPSCRWHFLFGENPINVCSYANSSYDIFFFFNRVRHCSFHCLIKIHFCLFSLNTRPFIYLDIIFFVSNVAKNKLIHPHFSGSRFFPVRHSILFSLLITHIPKLSPALLFHRYKRKHS